MVIRKAKLSDVENIHKLIAFFAEKKVMLARSLNYVYENIRDFAVAVDDDGNLLGCCALHVVGWETLAELKSLCVSEAAQKTGLGRKLVETCIEDGKSIGIKKFFTLTFVPGFFEKLEFNVVEKDVLPHKIWSDCIDCPFFPNCNEIALIKEI